MDAKAAPTSPNPSRLASASADAASPKPMLAFHFLRALSRVHGGPARRRTRTIHRAAYSSMARATGTRRAWSRALLRQAQARRSTALASRRTAVLVRRRVVAGPAPPPPARAAASARSSSVATSAGAAVARPLPPAQRQAGEPARSDALRRLVPGGAGMEYCSLLEETADYVRCLRAQVQLMQGLADLFACQ
uniref:Uncharacterized protein n=1 Tax=Avena sativa TaxID=4498 RepID=A0ACD5UGP9_AVESA